MDELPELINLPEVARRLGVTPARVHQLKGEGRIAFRRVGREWITTAAEVERFASLVRPRGAAGHLARKPAKHGRDVAPVESRLRTAPKPIAADSVPVRATGRVV